LYEKNVIADRSLIDRVADVLRTEPCRMLITSVPEVLEILYVQRTSRVGYRVPTSSSTLFPPVTMADYSQTEVKGGPDATVLERKPREPRVPPPSRPFRSKPIKRRWPGFSR
jgi:hypothetical protein